MRSMEAISSDNIGFYYSLLKSRQNVTYLFAGIEHFKNRPNKRIARMISNKDRKFIYACDAKWFIQNKVNLRLVSGWSYEGIFNIKSQISHDALSSQLLQLLFS